MNYRGPSPSEIPVVCPACGRRRYYLPTDIARLKSLLCKRCSMKRQYDTGERVAPAYMRKKLP